MSEPPGIPVLEFLRRNGSKYEELRNLVFLEKRDVPPGAQQCRK